MAGGAHRWSHMSEGRGERERPSGRVPPQKLVREVARLFRPYRVAVSGIVVLVLATAGLGVANPLLIKVVFDTALFPCGGRCPPDLPRLYVLVGVMVAIPVFTGAVGILQTYLTNRVGQRVMEDLRNRLYTHLQGMSLRFFTGTRTGEIQSRLTNDVGSIQSVVTDTASSLLSNVVILLSTLIAMLVLSWQLTALSLFITPLFVLYTYRAGRARRRITTQAQELKAEMSAITQETLSVSGILLSKVFGRRHEEIARFRQENRRLANLAIRQEMVGRVLFAVIGAFFSSAPALVYLIAGVVIGHTNNSGITAGTIVAFTTLQSRLFFPIGSLLQVSVEIQASLALFERIFDYLRMPHDLTDKPDAIVLDPASARGDVKFDHVSFRYDREAFGPIPADPGDASAGGTEHGVAAASNGSANDSVPNEVPRPWALDDVSFEVKPGQLAAIVGPSGAGKTTISYLIPRLYDVTRGRVLIDDIDVRDVRLDFTRERDQHGHAGDISLPRVGAP